MKETASNSWNAPLPVRFVSEEPARNNEGKALAEQLPICINRLSALLNASSSRTAPHPCQCMEDTWPSYQQANSGLACQIAIRTSRIAASLFVPKADEADAQVDGLFRNVNDGNAHEAENHGYAEITKCEGDDMSTRGG